jgi:hypothetical protein
MKIAVERCTFSCGENHDDKSVGGMQFVFSSFTASNLFVHQNEEVMAYMVQSFTY